MIACMCTFFQIFIILCLHHREYYDLENVEVRWFPCTTFNIILPACVIINSDSGVISIATTRKKTGVMEMSNFSCETVRCLNQEKKILLEIDSMDILLKINPAM